MSPPPLRPAPQAAGPDDPAAPVRPLLKWAGGKRQLLPFLAEHYPVRFTRYFEPFVGSGAVFFDLLASGCLAGHDVCLADMNPDLIGCYRTLRDRPEEVIEHLMLLERDYRARGDRFYYEVRDTRFNPERAMLLAHAAGRDATAGYPTSLAAMLIFLNRTGFNGLYRLNRRGEFNVPAGRYDEPRICDVEHLRRVAEAFRTPGVKIEHKGFDRTLSEAQAGDFIYCDPPYAPLSRTANFANYTAQGFTPSDQSRLQQAIVAACRRGAWIVMSNSSAPEIRAAYGAAQVKGTGLRIRTVAARRSINSRGSARGPVDELIITNVARRARAALPAPAVAGVRRLRVTTARLAGTRRTART